MWARGREILRVVTTRTPLQSSETPSSLRVYTESEPGKHHVFGAPSDQVLVFAQKYHLLWHVLFFCFSPLPPHSSPGKSLPPKPRLSPTSELHILSDRGTAACRGWVLGRDEDGVRHSGKEVVVIQSGTRHPFTAWHVSTAPCAEMLPQMKAPKDRKSALLLLCLCLSLSLYIYQSVSPFCLFFFLSLTLTHIHTHTHSLSFYIYIHMYIHLSISMYLSISLDVSISPSICLSLYPRSKAPVAQVGVIVSLDKKGQSLK